MLKDVGFRMSDVGCRMWGLLNGDLTLRLIIKKIESA